MSAEDFDSIDLQWFAAEDEGRTEEPSEYKIRKAREEGRVAKSQELNSAIVMLVTVIVLIIAAPYFWGWCEETLLFDFSCNNGFAIGSLWNAGGDYGKSDSKQRFYLFNKAYRTAVFKNSAKNRSVSQKDFVFFRRGLQCCQILRKSRGDCFCFLSFYPP